MLFKYLYKLSILKVSNPFIIPIKELYATIIFGYGAFLVA